MKKIFITILFLISIGQAHANMSDYKCTIERIVTNSGDSKESISAKTKFYIGKEFTIERRSGVMSGTLKNTFIARPEVIDLGSSENAYKAVVTLRKEQGLGAGSQVYVTVVREYQTGPIKPFVFLDNEEMYSGTCVHF